MEFKKNSSALLITLYFITQDFILEHYSEEPDKYDEPITEFMDLRGVSVWDMQMYNMDSYVYLLACVYGYVYGSEGLLSMSV